MRNFQNPGRSAVYATNAACATSHPLATATALDVLKAGGNAADAAIAAAAVLAVVEPHMTGIGGDCFAIISEPDGTVHGLNASGPAAMAADPSWFSDQGISEIGPDSIHSVTVPGAVRGWEALVSGFGCKSLGDLLQPAIGYARDGYVVAPRVAKDWSGMVERLGKNAGARKHFLQNGKAPLAGTLLKSPGMARALGNIAKNGSRGFYEGSVADDIVKTVREHGGLLVHEDLASMSVLDVKPISSTYRGYEVMELPPNGQGLAALIILNILENFDLASLDPAGPERMHLELEAGRIGYAIRNAHIADADYMKAEVGDLISKSWAKELAGSISPIGRLKNLPSVTIKQSDTIYLSIVDSEGRAVSFINSVFHGFGSAIVTNEYGIALQNRGSGFVLEPDHPNCIAGGKRPFHTIIPAMVRKDGKPFLCYGVMGGAYQALGHAHVLSNIVDFGMDVQEAIDAPRAFWEDDGRISVEDGFPRATLEGLAKLGHRVQRAPAAIGGSQAIQFDHNNNCLIAGSDPRKDGCAIGY